MRQLARVVERVEGWYASAGRWARWVPAAVWYAVIFMLSQSPGTDAYTTERYLTLVALGNLNTWLRIVAHLGVFGLLGLLIYAALARGFRPDRAAFFQAVALTALLGLLDEAHQHLVPLRQFRVSDALLDALGGALGIAIALVIARRMRVIGDGAEA